MNNNPLPLVSIITISYNSSKTIEQTIKSVISQEYPHIEYIIIDGGSTDGTLDIINKYKEKISLIISEADEGIYDAMNKGINNATGELIGIINSDDWYEPYTVKEIVNKYVNTINQSNTIFYGIIRLWKNNKEYAIRRFHHNFIPETVIQHPTCFVPRKLYKEYGIFNKKYKVAGDFDLLNRFLKKGVEFCNIDIVLANFRIGGASTKFSNIGAKEYLEIKFFNKYISHTFYKKQLIKIKLRNIIYNLKNIFK